MRKLLALIGGILFVLTIGVALWLLAREEQAGRLDNLTGRPVVSDPACRELSFTATLAKRVMTEDESQALIVILTNQGDQVCRARVTLSAPDFAVGPAPTNPLVSAPPGEEEVVWILSPHRAGTFQVAVTVNQASTILGVTVTNILGLTVWQARVLAALGYVLGPMLTVPWWYEKWQERKKLRPIRLSP
jgi:hypothetical protein